MGEPVHAPAAIARHYDERSPIGDELRNGQLHMWYWYDEDDPASLPEAVSRMSRKVTDTLGLRGGERVLDAGCGPGETAVWLARERDVEVTGVTLSEFEIARASERARTAGVDGRARFRYDDFSALSFSDGSFDAVLALESLQNAPDIAAAMSELFRVLRPGGRLALSDFSLESMAEPHRIATFMTTLKLRVLPTLAEWLDLVTGAGFVVEEYTQCGPRVFGMKGRYLKAAVEQRSQITAKFGDSAVSSYAQHHQGFFVPRKEQIGYVIVAARKPGVAGR
ncbi:methyltransferase domain-containing protein [Micromonospora sediminicola]|uniref:SAM-dependent methyltransferase n=1 Tax=Micromonospora sediminicola TaxID=946078 RepID=UPI0033E3998B